MMERVGAAVDEVPAEHTNPLGWLYALFGGNQANQQVTSAFTRSKTGALGVRTSAQPGRAVTPLPDEPDPQELPQLAVSRQDQDQR